MTRFVTRKKVAAGAAVVALSVGGMIAYAAWTSSGSGSGTVSARNALPLVVADGTAANTLYPNGKADLIVKLTNNNAYNVNVTSIVLGALASGSPTAIYADNGHSTCNASSVTYTPPTITGLVVGAGATTTVTLSQALSMDNNANDNCQGATFTVPVIANAASTAATPAPTALSY